MTLDLLCLGFTLLGILQAQAQDPPPALPMKPSLYKVPLKPNFQDDQVSHWKGTCTSVGPRKEVAYGRGQVTQGLFG